MREAVRIVWWRCPCGQAFWTLPSHHRSVADLQGIHVWAAHRGARVPQPTLASWILYRNLAQPVARERTAITLRVVNS